jgi:hypothetical protein
MPAPHRRRAHLALRPSLDALSNYLWLEAPSKHHRLEKPRFTSRIGLAAEHPGLGYELLLPPGNSEKSYIQTERAAAARFTLCLSSSTVAKTGQQNRKTAPF